VLSQPRSDAARAVEWLADQLCSLTWRSSESTAGPDATARGFRRRRSTVPAPETAGGR